MAGNEIERLARLSARNPEELWDLKELFQRVGINWVEAVNTQPNGEQHKDGFPDPI